MMTYEEALTYIHSVSWMGIRPGLERIRKLCERLGNPQDDLRFVHVAGTNGKGSTCVMLDAVLRAAGYRTGMFTSPYLWDFRERFMIDGKPISEALLTACTEQAAQAARDMSSHPTEFELITAIGFLCFRKAGCDIVVLETGMGGRLDSTNIIKSPLLSIITGVALDHMKILGDTVEKIAAEKAGIIKEGCPVLYGGNTESVRAIIAQKAQACGSPFFCTEPSPLSVREYTADGTYYDCPELPKLYVSLAGTYQHANTATVLRAVSLLRDAGLHITDDDIRHGLGHVYWEGRFERLHTDPDLFYDGSHNPQGIAAVAQSIPACLKTEHVVLVSGVMADKDYRTMIATIAPLTAHVFTITPNNPRALSAEAYAQAFSDAGVPATPCADADTAVRLALEEASRRQIPAFALGSLYMYREIRLAADAAEKVTANDTTEKR